MALRFLDDTAPPAQTLNVPASTVPQAPSMGVGPKLKFLDESAPPTATPEPAAPTYQEAAQPRLEALAKERGYQPPKTAQELNQRDAAAIGDAFSFVGRALVAGAKTGVNAIKDLIIPDEEKQSFAQAAGKTWDEFKTELEKTEAAQGGVSGLLENIMRDPATVATLPFAAAKGATGVVQALKAGALTGAKVGAVSAAAHQADRFAQTGDVKALDAVAEVGLSTALGGLGGTAGKFFEKLKKAPREVSDKLYAGYINPPKKTLDDGFSMDTIHKYDLLTDAATGEAKADQLITEASEQVQKRLNEGKAAGVTVDINKALMDAVEEIEGEKTKFSELFLPTTTTKSLKGIERVPDFNKELDRLSATADAPLANRNAAMQGVDDKVALERQKFDTASDILGEGDRDKMPLYSAFNRMFAQLWEITGGKADSVDPVVANQVRQSLGAMAAKAFSKQTWDDTGLEALAIKTYGNIKKQLDRPEFADLQDLNDKISELIPVRNAFQRRAPADEKASSVKQAITDLIASRPKVAKLFGMMETPVKAVSATAQTVGKAIPLPSRTAFFKYNQDEME